VEKKKFPMQLTYKYRLKPTQTQLAKIVAHLELGRRQYNYRRASKIQMVVSHENARQRLSLDCFDSPYWGDLSKHSFDESAD